MHRKLIQYIKTDVAEYFLYDVESPFFAYTTVIRRKAGFPAFFDRSVFKTLIKEFKQNDVHFYFRLTDAVHDEVIKSGEIVIYRNDVWLNVTVSK